MPGPGRGNVYQAQGPQGFLPYRAPAVPDPAGWKGFEDIFAGLNNLKNQDLMRILEGVKAGLIDPNEALVEGTKGGKDFERYFGTKPPAAPGPEMANTTMFPQNMQMEKDAGESTPFDASKEGLGTGGGIPFSAPTGKMKGGFTPQNTEQLKNFVVRKLAKGEPVSQLLLRAAGMDKGKNYSEELVLTQARNNPRMLREYTRLKELYGDEIPDEHIRSLLSTVSGEDFAAGAPAISGKTVTQKKNEGAAAFKEKDLAFKIQKSAEYIRTRDRKLDIDEQRFALENTGRALDRLSKHIGFDYAKDIVAALAEGKTLDEIPLPDEVKRRVTQEFNRKQQVADAKTTSASASMLRAQTQATIAPAKLEADVQRYNAMFEIQTNGQNLRDMNNYVKNNLNVAFKLMQNPATNAEGQRVLKDIAENQLGWDTGEPEGFQSIKEFAGRLFGVPGMGTPSVTPTKGPADVSPSVRPSPREAPKLNNAPRITPRGNAPKAKTAEEYLKRFTDPNKFQIQQPGPVK